MQELVSDIGAALRSRKWRSGSVLPASSAEAIAPYLRNEAGGKPRQISATDWVIVISHTCDLYAKKLDAEPWVEILHCVVIKKLDTSFTNQKSTRRLHFRPDRSRYSNLCLNAHATADRFFVPRELLTKHSPDADRQLPENVANAVRGWLALRCDRAAWPDELNDRLAPMRDQFVRALAPLDDDSTELRVAVQPPTTEGGYFELTVFLVVDEEAWNSGDDRRSRCQIAFSAFIGALSKTAGITVHLDSQALSGADFTWQLTRQTDVWNFANLTPMGD